MTETKAPPPNQEHPYPPAIVPYPHQAYNGAPYPPPGPPGAYMPPFFAYPPPPDGSHPEGGQNGAPPAPYMIGLPPGVVYAYPPHPQAQPFAAPPANASTTPPALRPKRKQVKMACTNCAGACKRCDETRPCERCVKYGIADTCVDGQRKERKKGIKRGPYKRKTKAESEAANFNGDWPNGTPPSTTTTAAAIHAVTQYAPEGYYPVYYPPPGFMAHPHDGPPGPDGSPPHANGQPIMPYYIHPGTYPPFPHYPAMYPPGAAPPPGAHPPPPSSSEAGQPSGAQPEQPQTVNPSDTARKDDTAPAAERNGVEVAPAGKKRSRTTKNGEPKVKKVKIVNGSDTAAATSCASKEKEHETTALPTGDGAEHQARDDKGESDKSA